MQIGDIMIVQNIADAGSGNEVMETQPDNFPAYAALRQTTASYSQVGITTTPVKITCWDHILVSPRVMTPSVANSNITLGTSTTPGSQIFEITLHIDCTTATASAIYDFSVFSNGTSWYRMTRATASGNVIKFFKSQLLAAVDSSVIDIRVSKSTGTGSIFFLFDSYFYVKRIA